MKKIIVVLVMLIGLSMHSQYDSFNYPYYPEVRLSVDPSVLIDEGNFNIKAEFSDHFNRSKHWRINVVVETLTGHDGYYGADIGVGFSIPYRIGFIHFRVEPGIAVGLIYRPNMYTFAFHGQDGYEYDNKGFLGSNHSLSLRHSIQVAQSKWSIYIHSRLIYRVDLHFANELTLTPEDLPYYNYDNAVGISHKFN